MGKFDCINMKKTPCNTFQLAPFYISVCLIVFTFQTSFGQDQTTRHAWMITNLSDSFHYQPKKIDDAFAKAVFINFIELLDQNKIYFTQEEISDLEKSYTNIDDEIKNQKNDFLEKTKSLYISKINSTETVVNAIQADKIKFDTKAEYSWKKDKEFPSAANFNALWLNRVKAQILLTHYEKFEDESKKTKPTAKEIKELLEVVKSRESCRIKAKKNAKGGIEAYVNQAYLKAITAALDPHSSYFTRDEETEFQNMLSKETRSFGIEFYPNENGEIEISSLIPGGPAWNSNELNEEDILLKVVTKSGELILDCSAITDLENFLTNEKLDEATLFVRKKNGTHLEVTLKKEVIEVSDNIIESFILKGEKSIGYIYLPSFYTNQDYAFSYTSGCANDLAKELLQLKNEGIDGLILDLRNNGGGSMLEAILLAGIFVDYGAISIVHSRDDTPQTLKDINRGKVFHKPLIILVNDYSASASELFAAAMQDHNRAIIVGTTTYGKSTSQQVLPIDQFLYNSSPRPEIPVEAYVKLTTGSFYRATGETHQGKGIVPDIYLASRYEKLNQKESTERNYLTFEAIQKKTYFTPEAKFPLQELAQLSEKRNLENKEYLHIKEQSQLFAERRNNFVLPLQIDDFEKHFFKKENEFESVPSALFQVTKPSYIVKMSHANSTDLKIDQDNAEDIQSDFYIVECFQIMLDLLHLAK